MAHGALQCCHVLPTCAAALAQPVSHLLTATPALDGPDLSMHVMPVSALCLPGSAHNRTFVKQTMHALSMQSVCSFCMQAPTLHVCNGPLAVERTEKSMLLGIVK